MKYEIGDAVTPGPGDLQEAFRQTPEWKAYHEAHREWERLHGEYFHAGPSTKGKAREQMLRAQAEYQRLLAICRAMPEHKKAFGW